MPLRDPNMPEYVSTTDPNILRRSVDRQRNIQAQNQLAGAGRGDFMQALIRAATYTPKQNKQIANMNKVAQPQRLKMPAQPRRQAIPKPDLDTVGTPKNQQQISDT